MLSRWRSFIIFVGAVVLWKLFVFVAAYFGLYTLQRIMGALLVVGVGIFLVFKKAALADATKTSDDILRRHNIWPWSSVPGFSIKIHEMMWLAAGWLFVAFGALGIFGLVRVNVR